MSEHDDRLRELGRELPWDRPDPARREAVRSSLLIAAAEGERPPRTRWGLVGGAFVAGVLAAAAAVLVLRGGGDHPAQPPVAVAPAGSPGAELDARIEASPEADVERSVSRTPTGVDEVVRVHAGKVRVAVGAVRTGDHVKIATRDAEVEGAGSYEVDVADDAIREVRVEQGSAVVRVVGEQAVFLASGQTWRARTITAQLDLSGPAPAVTPSPTVTPSPSVTPSPTVTPTPMATRTPTARPATTARSEPVAPPMDRATTSIASPAPHRAPAPMHASDPSSSEAMNAAPRAVPQAELPAPSDTETTQAASPERAPSPDPAPTGHHGGGETEVEQHFLAGWKLLKAGRAAEAARELGAAADAGGDAPLAADARYFQAIALTKSGRKTEAEHVLVAFLDHAPHSIRRGRAEVMLARLIAERGDTASARAWFSAALQDPDPDVVAAARAGLAQLPH